MVNGYLEGTIFTNYKEGKGALGAKKKQGHNISTGRIYNI